MAFYLSPLVDVKEIDLSTTIPAVATSIGVIVLRNTYKGPEMKTTFVTSEDELIRMFGMPTTESYRDMLAAAGYLKYGNKLYCTRVMPLSATFAGVDVPAAGTEFETYTPHTSANALMLVDLDNPDDIYAGDPNNFHEMSVDDGSALKIIASSRGAWGDNIKVVIVDRATKTLLDRTKRTTASVTTGALSAWYPYDMAGATKSMWSTAPTGTQMDLDEATYFDIVNSDIKLSSDDEFLILVKTREQGQEDWQITEQWYVSTTEGKLDDNGVVMYAETLINETSRYIKINMNESYKNVPWTEATPMQYTTLGGGRNGIEYIAGEGDWGVDYSAYEADNSIDKPSYVPFNSMMYALDLYANPEEIDVTMVIDAAKPEELKRYMISFCETRKDCMAILDCPYELVVNNRGEEVVDLVEWRTGTGAFVLDNDNLNENTSYAALYGNWLEVFDKYNNKYRWIPASGHVAGIYAHTDDVTDPWWAPAGLNRAILTNVRRLAWNPKLGHRDMLYKSGINPIVSFAGQGKVIWGQKTMLDKSSSFNRVNVRRLFIVLEKAISTAAKYFLFEPNDYITRLQLKNMILPFLRDVQARRGIYDYQVICDETNNTPERIDRNELWCTILIKATRVAEFIVLQFVSLKTGASFEESAAAVNAIPDNN